MNDIRLQVGTPVPWFVARSPKNPRFHFDTVAGRYAVLSFLGSMKTPVCARLWDALLLQRNAFDDHNVAFFGVITDPEDERTGRAREALPGIHVLWDFDLELSHRFGATRRGSTDSNQAGYRPFSLVLDERLRVVAVAAVGDEPERHVARLMEVLAALPPLDAPTAAVAPLLTVPRVFEPKLCQALIRYYEEHGGGESGFMLEVDGKTVGVHDHRHKRRRDQEVLDQTLRRACMVRIHDRLVPEISRAFQFNATRIERYLVACYDARDRGHFRAHRDNTTPGTAHRRFAVSVVLNTGDFEGGGLTFPEFGRQTHGPPLGGALVFSCSLLHEVRPVTRGQRYAFLPFLYDEAAALGRQANASPSAERPPSSG
jgi:peroxiredoxin/predicted 2-oxoglutarate/Fe(II)-dependent dioxygenase YbiX